MRDSKTVQLPWQGVLAVGAAIAGAVWYFAPLDTSRPVERGGVSLKLIGDQDVDARLWQDPLATAFAHEERIRAIDSSKDPVPLARENAIHSIKTLVDRIGRERSRSVKLLVLPVLVSGGAYAEYGENRLRARRAVLEALGTNQFSPDRGEHIGYVRMRSLDPIKPPLALPGPALEYFILPYEWCGPAFGGKTEEKVLVLWVREEELGKTPLKNLASLLSALTIDPSNVKVIGPRTSTALVAMVNEVTDPDYQTLLLQNMTILSPTATMSEELFLRGKEKESVATVKELLEKKVPRLQFHRITTDDRIVCRELIRELRRRGIRLNQSRGRKNGDFGSGDQVALISEWDTFYGRALPLSFAREASGWDLATLIQSYPKNIHAFHYLRGIDGMLPGPTQGADPSDGKKTDSKTRARETIEGLNQADYLRRLALQLQEIHHELIFENKGGLKAVGVLGSDVYDKLLVLKALRPAFPGVLFFTNNLDARLAHPDEWAWTRNLIVASPFGLRLREQWKGDPDPFELQGKILPFRDAYQTAAYTATLIASKKEAAALWEREFQAQNAKAVKGSVDKGAKPTAPPGLLGLPRLFEIAQSGPYELPGEIRAATPPNDLHPVRTFYWWNERRIIFAARIAFALTCLVAWVLLVVQARNGQSSTDEREENSPQKEEAHEHASVVARLVRQLCSFPSWAVFIVGALAAWRFVSVLADIQLHNGEPFVWMEGISIWPTETMRLLVVLMAVWYFIKTNESLKKNEDTISDKFGLRFPTPPWWRFEPIFRENGRKELFDSLRLRNWDVEANNRIVAEKLWQHYIRSGQAAVQFIRIAPLAILYVAAGVCLMFLLLLGFPPVPGRGRISFFLDFVFLFLAIFSSIGLTFYIADATMLNRRLIDHLVMKETDWPQIAYEKLRQRWKVSTPAKKSRSSPQGSRRGTCGWITSFLRSMKHFKLKISDWATRSSATTDPESSGRMSEIDSISSDDSAEVPPRRLLDEYLDIDLIATRTEVVGGLIYYPFILITLMIVSRISLFDNWTWPVGLFIVIAGNGGYAAWSAWKLRRTAENARQTAIGNLNGILISHMAGGDPTGPEARTARETIAMITAEERGAFAAISRHPLIGALLLPSGGAGIWALTQYLPGLF